MAFLKVVVLALLCMYASCNESKARENDAKTMQQMNETPEDAKTMQQMKGKNDASKKMENTPKDKVQKDAKPFLGPIGDIAGAIVSGVGSVAGGIANGVAGAAHGIVNGAAHIVNTAVCAVKGVGAAISGKEEHKCQNGNGENGASCPSSHPFAYFGGSFCCKYNREKVYEPQGRLCDGSVIGLESKCCKSDADIECPAGKHKCRNHRAQPAQPAQQSVQCNWVPNHAGNGQTLQAGLLSSHQCASACYNTKDRGINGALIRHQDKMCFCLVGATAQPMNNQFSSCIFQVVGKDAEVKPKEKEVQVEDFFVEDLQSLEMKKKK